MMIRGKRSHRKSKFRDVRKAHDPNRNPTPTAELATILTTISVASRALGPMEALDKIEMAVVTSKEASFSASVLYLH